MCRRSGSKRGLPCRLDRPFFPQAASLLPFVPFYPVPGNHELNHPLFFRYFHLPANGSEGKEEHWWFKDHGNVRIIGLDSNRGYRNRDQLEWLGSVLLQAERDTTLDFVFVLLHHPYKSELWLTGETSYTRKIIALLEDFSGRCGKPSLHLFGHAHGYSRGQSAEPPSLGQCGHGRGTHRQLEGTGPEELRGIRWSATPITASFSSTWRPGRILVHPHPHQPGRQTPDPRQRCAGPDPGPALSPKPETPVPSAPRGDTVVQAGIVVLQAGAYRIAEDGPDQSESQWQVCRRADFGHPDFDLRSQHQDWYEGTNLRAGSDLCRQTLTGLDPNTTYFWRVRYRSQGLCWSDWSEPASFRTE
ncbi:MAG: metallophosphoesterase [Bacteroidales bacterium]